MPDISLPVSIGNLPEGLCPQTEQERANAIAAALQVLLPFNVTFFNTGSTAPTADNRIFGWDRSNMDGTPDKLYHYVNGFWIAPNPVPASSPLRQFYVASLGSIDTYDGGEVGAVTATTGPMWEVATDMEGRTAIGVSSDFAFNTTGDGNVTLLAENLPSAFDVTAVTGNDTSGANITGFYKTNPSNQGQVASPIPVTLTNTGGGQPFSAVPPHLSAYWIKRTARQFYRL